MEIQATQTAQTYQTNTSKSSQKVEELFESMVNDEGYLNTSLDESELKKLSYEEAKALREKLEESGYLKQTDENGNSHIGFGSSLLQVTNMTNDDAFNKSMFETLKTKKEPGLFLMEVKHNMEYSQGRREHPWPSISVDEAQGNFSPLTSDEIKNIDIQEFLADIIKTYEELLLNLPSYLDREETQETLKNYQELQKSYQKNKDEEYAILESYTKNTKPNPLLV